MRNVSIDLDIIHCNEESDNGGAEPYMWTQFFYMDVETGFRIGRRVITNTPGKNFTTRQMYQDGIKAGDDFTVPNQLGKFNISLNDAGLGLELVGIMVMMFDRDDTDGDMVIAGHQAFAEAGNKAWNDYIETTSILNAPEPNELEIDRIRETIYNEVSKRWNDAKDPWDRWDDQDRFIGFGHKFFTHEELNEISSNANGANPGAREFIISVKNRKHGIIIDDYDVMCAIQATSSPSPLQGFIHVDAFQKAVSSYKKEKEALSELKAKMKSAKSIEKKGLRAKIEYQRAFSYKAAKKNLKIAHGNFAAFQVKSTPE